MKHSEKSAMTLTKDAKPRAAAAAQGISILLNLSVAVLSAVGTAISFGKHGCRMFQFYTVDSNIFAMLACAVYAVFLIRRLIAKAEIPAWAAMVKYAAVCCLAVTFLVVVAVLAPVNGAKGYQMMLLHDDMLYHHLLCPLLAALSFFLFDRVPVKAGKAARFALLPTVVYAVVTVILNLVRVLVGPYPFLMVYRQSVCLSVLWVFLILGGAYAFAWLVARLRHKID